MTLLAVVAILALVALTGSVLYAARVFSHTSTALAPAEDWSGNARSLDRHEAEILTLRAGLADLTLAVDEGIKGYKRAENRVQKTVTSARRLIRENGLEHAGIEAEYEELHDGNDEPSPSGEVLPLFEEVEASTRTGIPGVDSAELARMRESMHV